MLTMLDIAVIGTFLLSTLIIGFYFGKKITTVQEYATGGRNFTTPVLVSTIFATWVGAGTIFGMPSKVFSFGIVFVLVFFGIAISNLFVARYVTPRMTRFLGMISVGEIMENFYGKPGRIVTGFLGVILCIGQLGAQIAAIGYLFDYFFEISYIYGVLLGCGIVIFYSTFGGIRAVTYTDVFQFMVLIVVIPIIAGMGLKYVGGFDQLITKVPSTHLQIFPENESPFKYLALLVIFSMPFLNPAITQRLLMAKDEKQMKTAMLTSAFIQVPFYIVTGLIGLVVYSIDQEVSSGMVLPYLINNILPMGIKGLAIIGIIAVLMSTADSMLNSAGIALIHDVVQPLRTESMGNDQELFWIRITTFCVGSLSVYAALSFENVFEIMIAFLNYWGPMIVIPLYAGLFNVKGSPRCFVFSALAGLITVVSWSVFDIETYLEVGALVPAMIANFLVFMLMKDSSLSPLTFWERVSLWMQQFRPHVICEKMYRKALVYRYMVYDALQFSQTQIAERSSQAVLFSGFAILMFLLPYFFWAQDEVHETLNLVLRIFGGGLCAGILFRDSWGTHVRRYFSWYFQATLLYCLPFLTTFMLLESQGSALWSANMALALILLALLVDWLSFSLLLPTGVILAWGLYSLLPGSPGFQLTGPVIFTSIYACLFAFFAGVLFSRNREIQIEQKHAILKALSGSIAHELRTPLSGMFLGISGMKKYQPELVKAYRQMQQDPNFQKKIDDQQLQVAETLSGNLLNSIERANIFIDMILMKLKDVKEQKLEHIISMQKCTKEALEIYPFIGNQRSLVECNIDDHFFLHGQEDFMHHVIFNLLKNSLYQIQACGKGKIQIWSTQNETCNTLHFKDTASGIAAEKLSLIFEKFYTQTNHGTGIGLAFCQHVVENFGGQISCESVEGDYTEFIMCFPKLSPDIIEQNLEKLSELQAA